MPNQQTIVHTECCSSPSKGYWFTILLFLLPKCPVCFVAYSSAITVCGVSSLEQPSLLDFRPLITISVGLFILALAIIRFREKSMHKWVIAIGSFGIAILAVQAYFSQFILLYYFGTVLIVLSSLLYSIRIQRFIHKSFSFVFTSKPNSNI